MRQLLLIDMGEGRHGSVFQITGTYSCSPSGTAARPVLEQQGHGRMTIRPEESCLAGTGTAQEAAVAAAGIIEGIERPCWRQMKERKKDSFHPSCFLNSF